MAPGARNRKGSPMNRRLFLSALGAAITGTVLDPERALWVPGARKIFIPPVRPAVPFWWAQRRGPIMISANRTLGGDVAQARVFEGLLNYRYATDSLFRRLVDGSLHPEGLVQDEMVRLQDMPLHALLDEGIMRPARESFQPSPAARPGMPSGLPGPLAA
jgi:hypothetical protein